ncbi:MAG: hypothetical protein LH473_07840, partial [Chitinophagales bacterium]|nr:hypothetical protein [Chitinophagales bacterium]
MKKNILTAFLSLLILKTCFAQSNPPSIVWQHPIGGSKDDTFRGMRLTEDGGCVVTGYAFSSDSDLTKNNGKADVLTAKLNSLGNIEWINTFGGSKEDWGRHISITADNGYIVCGHAESSDFDVTGNKGQKDAWLLKFDHEGNLEWKKTFGGSGVDIAYKVYQLSTNGFIFFGGTTSKNGDVSGNHGNADYWVVQIDSIGNIQWQKCYGGVDHEEGSSLSPTSDGGYITSGWSNSNSGDVSGNHGGFDVWVNKIDHLGNLEWARSYGGSGDDAARDAKETYDGGFIISGFTNSDNGDVQSGYRGGQDVWVIKTDAFGNIQWERALGGSQEELAFAVTLAPDSTGYFVCGHERSEAGDGDITFHWGDLDWWIIKLDMNGNILWQKSLGGTSDDKAREILQRGTGGDYWVAGYENVNNGDVYGANGGFDGWVVRLCEQQTYFADSDGDGFGNASDSLVNCIQPLNYVLDKTDCNDANSLVHPGSNDICNDVDDNCNGIIDENKIVATISPQGDLIICKGTYTLLSANTAEGITYQWLKSGANILGETNSTYSTKKGGDYQVSESNSFNCFSTSATTSILTVAKPNATITPLGNLDICITGSVVLQANSGDALTYQWKKGGANISGATNQIYTATSAATYKVKVTNSTGCYKTSIGTVVTNSCKEELNNQENDLSHLTLFPNPGDGNFVLNLKLNEEYSGDAVVVIINTIGQQIYNQKYAV